MPLSVNIKRRANRVAQLEASRAKHAAAEHRPQSEAARERWASERGEWFRMFAPPPSSSEIQSDDAPSQQWTPPDWTEHVDACNDAVRYDIVWTIS